MSPHNNSSHLLRHLPGIDRIKDALSKDPCFGEIPARVMVAAAREVVENLRESILAKDAEITAEDLSLSAVVEKVKARAEAAMSLNLQRLVNATGVIVHTNLGRSLLSEAAADNVRSVATGYSNLEYDLSRGRRGSRYSAVEEIICEISGASAAMVVNNNAAAVLLCLDTLAKAERSSFRGGNWWKSAVPSEFQR